MAVKVTGEPTRPVTVAVTEFPPGDLPSCHEFTDAMPKASETADAPTTVPAPVATAKVTACPATTLLPASRIITDGVIATKVPGAVVCPSPALSVMVFAAPVVTVTSCDAVVSDPEETVVVPV